MAARSTGEACDREGDRAHPTEERRAKAELSRSPDPAILEHEVERNNSEKIASLQDSGESAKHPDGRRTPAVRHPGD